MERKKTKTGLLVQASVIAALYVVLSLLTYQFSYLQIQCRVAEALCMTIAYTPAGVWGVTIGCLLTNIFGGNPLDMIFGTLATLIAAFLTLPIAKMLKKKYGDKPDIKHSLLIPIPTVLVNTVIIPFVLYFGYGITEMGSATGRTSVLLLMALSIFAGEAISCFIFGPIIIAVLNRIRGRLKL